MAGAGDASLRASLEAGDSDLREAQAIAGALARHAIRLEHLDAGVEVSDADLDAYARASRERDPDFDLADFARERAIRSAGAERLGALVDEVRREDGARRLTARLLDAMASAGDVEPSSAGAAYLAGLIERLAAQGGFGEARSALERIGGGALLALPVEQLVLQAAKALERAAERAALAEVSGFLRALGPAAVPPIIAALEKVQAKLPRQVLRELVVDLGIPDPHLLAARLAAIARPAAALDVLEIARRLPHAGQAVVLLRALEHPAAAVRARAVNELGAFAGETAERLVADRINDPDGDVRAAAVKAAAARKSAHGARAIRALFDRDDLWGRDAAELALLASTYASILGDAAVPALAQVASPGLFGSRRKTGAQVAAVSALGAIGNDAARAVLRRAAWTFNRRVREACKRALERGPVTDGPTRRRAALAGAGGEDLVALALRTSGDASHGGGLFVFNKRSAQPGARARAVAPSAFAAESGDATLPSRLPSSAIAPIRGVSGDGELGVDSLDVLRTEPARSDEQTQPSLHDDLDRTWVPSAHTVPVMPAKPPSRAHTLRDSAGPAIPPEDLPAFDATPVAEERTQPVPVAEAHDTALDLPRFAATAAAVAVDSAFLSAPKTEVSPPDAPPGGAVAPDELELAPPTLIQPSDGAGEDELDGTMRDVAARVAPEELFETMPQVPAKPGPELEHAETLPWQPARQAGLQSPGRADSSPTLPEVSWRKRNPK